ncbi:hypothetical protein A8F94_03895 [Bacillus sp. FJAT-27225]|uniref:hypothetical protein n=1 Tax=Bacillus sp. FJAT-27225 TaxID=1743144 RepID=UPI00080C2173|nr:hypothetical protein [Bacillus sp. FJAT-27225]OCA91015.1 hypothetical protein A8F94_03895 [Bacillus sp. FJAT-27225]
MEFPIVYTNVWDAVIAVPAVMIFTQIVKLYFRIPKSFVPTIALVTGLALSILVTHTHSFWSAVFMGWFYGYAAIGSYSSLKTSWKAYRGK